jgi:putative hydrolase of the HAD superfamily
MDYESKPQPGAYRRICQLLRVRPEECVLVEDNMRNLHPAKALGMVTVLVGDGTAATNDGIDYSIPRIEEIGNVLTHIAAGT